MREFKHTLEDVLEYIKSNVDNGHGVDVNMDLKYFNGGFHVMSYRIEMEHDMRNYYTHEIYPLYPLEMKKIKEILCEDLPKELFEI